MEKCSEKLEFNPNTSKLTVTRLPMKNCDKYKSDSVNMSASGFFAGCFVAPPDKNKIVIFPQSYGKKEVSVETMHNSCQSDMLSTWPQL